MFRIRESTCVIGKGWYSYDSKRFFLDEIIPLNKFIIDTKHESLHCLQKKPSVTLESKT